MIVSISQPAYLPWLGYFDRIAESDVHIVLDQVPLERSSTTRFTNRNKVRGSDGVQWLTVPVKGASTQPLIRDTAIDNEQRWQARHRRTLEQSYRKAPHFASVEDLLSLSFDRSWDSLGELLAVQRKWLLSALGVTTRIEIGSQLHVPGSKSELILNLCSAVGASTYLSGPFGRDYLDGEAFAKAGIALRFHNYQHPQYPQLQQPFEPYLSVFDLLANCGSHSLRLLRSEST